MTNKRTHDEVTQRRELQNNGWQVHKRDAVAFNSGSETIKHSFSKMAVAYVLKERNYRIDTEVEMKSGEVDVLAYGREDGDIIAVEVEHSPKEDVIEDKLSRYYENEPPRDVFIVNANRVPIDMIETVDYIRGVL